MPCQVPRTSSPPETITVTDGPTQDVRRWAWEFPSACRYSGLTGNAFSSPYSMSVFTSGSAFSLMVSPAVVCSENTKT